MSWHRVRRSLAAAAIVGLAAGTLSACGQSDPLREETNRAGARDCLASRNVMRVAAQVVRIEKPAPAAAARFYAYVASAYSDAVEHGSQLDAVDAVDRVIGELYPDRAAATARALGRVAASVCTRGRDVTVRDDVVQTYVRRMKSDGHQLRKVDPPREAPGVWVAGGVQPATPRAGDWQRWVVREPVMVPPPPVYGSERDRAEMSRVVAAVDARDGEWVAKINFWGGMPGSDTPAGIWQNQLFTVVSGELDRTSVTADRTYARVQALLAQVTADAFMECWRVKYTYWTARPSMRLPDLELAMGDPPFPSYVSGHAAVSAAAAEVLSRLLPKHANEWRAMARDAADSRLFAGIHFEVDTVEGTKLGRAVGQRFSTALELKAVVT